jgi:hypothetical protein
VEVVYVCTGRQNTIALNAEEKGITLLHSSLAFVSMGRERTDVANAMETVSAITEERRLRVKIVVAMEYAITEGERPRVKNVVAVESVSTEDRRPRVKIVVGAVSVSTERERSCVEIVEAVVCVFTTSTSTLV